MNTPSVSHLTNDQFFANTKSALESFTGSPIKQEAKIRQFITHQFCLPNEHVIDAMFNPHAQEPTISGARIFVVNLYTTQENETEITNTRYCSDEGKLKSALVDFFCSAFPESSRGGKAILDYSIVEDKIADIAELQHEGDEDEDAVFKTEEIIKEKIGGMDSGQAMHWMMDNFEITDLCDDFIKDITMNYYSIEFQTVRID